MLLDLQGCGTRICFVLRSLLTVILKVYGLKVNLKYSLWSTVKPLNLLDDVGQIGQGQNNFLRKDPQL